MNDDWLIDLVFLISLYFLLVVILLNIHYKYTLYCINIQTLLRYQVPLLSPLHQMFLSQMDTIQLNLLMIMIMNIIIIMFLKCLLVQIAIELSTTSIPRQSHLIQFQQV